LWRFERQQVVSMSIFGISQLQNFLFSPSCSSSGGWLIYRFTNLFDAFFFAGVP
jgi:hypothetical protein